MRDWIPLTRSFGAMINGFSADSVGDPATAKAITVLLNERGLIVFRGSSFTAAQQISLCRAVGPVNKHPVREAWVDGHPELTRISYDPDKKPASLMYEIDGIKLANCQPWHIDGIYGPKIERGGCLRALVVPDDGPQQVWQIGAN
jgi:alpha-ketoglutarate-dependent taurine dioxygenase